MVVINVGLQPEVTVKVRRAGFKKTISRTQALKEGREVIQRIEIAAL
jgi:ribosomal protein L34